MAKNYRNFTARTVTAGFGPNGYEATFIGAFYDYHTPQSYKKYKTLVLCTKLPAKDIQKMYNDWLFVETTADTIAKAVDLVENTDRGYHRAEISLTTVGREIVDVFVYSSAVA
jgi:hypothetical protein